MTGKRKNEQLDILSQAQKIVDEYEDKYFKCLGEAFVREKRNKARRNTFILAACLTVLMLMITLKILL